VNLDAPSSVHRPVRSPTPVHLRAFVACCLVYISFGAASSALGQDAPDGGASSVAAQADVTVGAQIDLAPSASGGVVGTTPAATSGASANVRVDLDARAAADRAASAAVNAIPILPVRLRLELAFGGVGAEDVRLLGPSVSIGGGVDIDLASFFGLGARAHYLVAGAVGDARPLRANYFGGAALFRLWTDRPRREGFSLELGAGYLMVASDLAPSGAVLDIALARLAGASDGRCGQGFGGAIIVRGQHGVGAASGYRALSLGVEADLDFNLPGTGGAASTRAAFRYVLGAEGLLGVGLGRDGAREPGGFSGGFGAWAGFPLGPVFEPRVRLDVVRRAAGDADDARYGYGAAGGIRLRFDRWTPLYLEAHGGYAWLTERGSGAYADVGAGLRFTPCDDDAHFAVLLGARGRVGFGDAVGLSGVFATLGFEYVGGPSYVRPRCIDAPPEPVEAEVVVDVTPVAVVVSPNPQQPTTPRTVAPTPTTVSGGGSAEGSAEVEGSAEYEGEDDGMDFRLPLRLAVELVFGWLDARTSVNHFASGFAIPLDVQITRWFALGARFGVITGSDGPTDLNLDARDDLNERDFTAVQLSIGPRFTLWTDEVSHEGWDFELGGGWMGRGSRLDGPGVLAEAALLRRVGTISDGGIAADVSLGVRYQQGFGQASEFRALLLTMRAGLGFSQPLPEGQADTTPGFSYTLGVHAGFGAPFAAPGPLTNGQLTAIGLHFGLPIGPWLEARARADFVHRAQGTTPDGNYTSMLSYAGSGVVRLRLDRVAPLYFEAGAGYAASIGAPALYVPDASFAVFGGGFRVTFCDSDSALEAGVEARVGLGDNRGIDGIFFTVGGELAGGRRTIGERGFWCRFARRQAAVGASGGSMQANGSIGGSTAPNGSVGRAVMTPVVAPPPQPVVVEVLLGVSLFGGALDLRVDPSMLPLARLAGAGRVEVRIEGPAAALASAELRVRAIVDADGKRLDAVAQVPTNGSQVRAVFTIWPAGAR